MNTEILKYINADTAAGLTGVLCTIIEAQGSSPREAGTSMWVTADVVRGTVGAESPSMRLSKSPRDVENRRCYLYYKEKSYRRGRPCLWRCNTSVS